jgi:hypothetical protein
LFAADPALQQQLLAGAYQAVRDAASQTPEAQDADDELAGDEFTLAPSSLRLVSVPTPQWFAPGKMVEEFGTFLQRIAATDPAALGALLGAAGQGLAAVLAELEEIARQIEHSGE